MVLLQLNINPKDRKVRADRKEVRKRTGRGVDAIMNNNNIKYNIILMDKMVHP